MKKIMLITIMISTIFILTGCENKIEPRQTTNINVVKK